MKYTAITIVVFVLFGACKAPVDKATLYNIDASFTKGDSLPFNPLEWSVITTVMNTNAHSMSTLYGNEIAVAYAKSGGKGLGYPGGSVLSLVTWTQREDKYWFGANIPQKIQSVEVVAFDSTASPKYTDYVGAPLQQHLAIAIHDLPLISDVNKVKQVSDRVNYITSQQMAVIP